MRRMKCSGSPSSSQSMKGFFIVGVLKFFSSPKSLINQGQKIFENFRTVKGLRKPACYNFYVRRGSKGHPKSGNSIRSYPLLPQASRCIAYAFEAHRTLTTESSYTGMVPTSTLQPFVTHRPASFIYPRLFTCRRQCRKKKEKSLWKKICVETGIHH